MIVILRGHGLGIELINERNYIKFFKYPTFLSLLAISALNACAAATDGSSQHIMVSTSPVSGARCELTNDNNSWSIESTPANVTVHREASDLSVICKKGELSGTARVESVTKSLAFGNILAGGIIGVAVDRGNGAAFDYPSSIRVPMAKGGRHTDILPPTPAQNDRAYPQ